MYDAIWEAIKEDIQDNSGKSAISIDREVEMEDGTFLYFTARMLLYWDTWREPEGYYRTLMDIVPIWWELDTYRPDKDGELEQFPNDATFKNIRNLAYDYYAA